MISTECSSVKSPVACTRTQVVSKVAGTLRLNILLMKETSRGATFDLLWTLKEDTLSNS